jgi:hypothetical protein
MSGLNSIEMSSLIRPRSRHDERRAESRSDLHESSRTGSPTLPDWCERVLGWQGWLDLLILRREAEAALKK